MEAERCNCAGITFKPMTGRLWQRHPTRRQTPSNHLICQEHYLIDSIREAEFRLLSLPFLSLCQLPRVLCVRIWVPSQV